MGQISIRENLREPQSCDGRFVGDRRRRRCRGHQPCGRRCSSCFRRTVEQIQVLRTASAATEARRSCGEAFRRTQHPRHARYGRPAYPHASHPSAGALVCRHGGVDPRRDHREFAAGRIFLLHPERADRSRWCDHPVERTAWRDGLEGRAGAGYRLHRRVEAGRGSAADLAQARRVDPRSRRPAGGRQYRAGQWGDRRGRTCGASRCR